MEYFQLTPSKYHDRLIIALSVFTLIMLMLYELPLLLKIFVAVLLSLAVFFHMRRSCNQVIRVKFDNDEQIWWLQINAEAKWQACKSIQHLNIGSGFLWLSVLGVEAAPINLLLGRDSMSPDILMQLRRCMLQSKQ